VRKNRALLVGYIRYCRTMAWLAALCALATLQGGAQLPASLLEEPVPTAPSASCAPGVRCLASGEHNRLSLVEFGDLAESIPSDFAEFVGSLLMRMLKY
jgi:hypothetical protein